MDALNLVNILSSCSAVILFFGSILAILIGKIFYGISIFQPIEEIAYKQERYRKEQELKKFNDRMIVRNLELGNSFLDINHLQDAKDEFGKALSLDPTNVKAHLGLIKSEVFKPILEQDPTHYDPETAEKKLNLILNENPNDKHALLFLGRIYTEIDTQTALNYFNRALSIDPQLSIVYCAIAYIYTKQNKNDDALEMMKMATCFSQWNPFILNNLGHQYLIRQQYEKSIDQFEFLLKFYPYFLIGYFNISNTYMMKGDFGLAYKYQRKLIELVEDENIMSQKFNRGSWFFNTEPGKGVNFVDLKEKQFYSYYYMALTCCLLDFKEQTQEFINKARKLAVYDKASTKVLLNFNIDSLQKKDRNLTNKLNSFKEILGLGFNNKDQYI